MKNNFEVAIIGAGPSAIAALIKIKSKNVIVITGQEKFNEKERNGIHKKIYYLENEKKYLNNFFYGKFNNIFASSRIGGFGNYWGQGCEYVEFQKLYQNKNFTSEQEYKNYIKDLFTFFNVQQIKDKITFNKIDIKPQLILEHSHIKKNTKLKSFENTFNYIIKKKNIKIYNIKVLKLIKAKGKIVIYLNDGKKIFSKKVLLAANTIGNADIMFNSDQSISCLSFQDDCPWLVYSISLNIAFKSFLKKYYILVSSNLNQYFISFYNFSKIKFDFLFFYIFNLRLKFKFLKNINCSLFSFINFFQIWEKNTIVKINLYRDRTFKFTEKTSSSTLNRLIKKLKKNLFFIFKIKKTPAGHGFHYHNLKVINKNNKRMYFENYLKLNYSNKVLCIDGSICKKINPGSFTISLMALAQKKIEENKF